MDSAVVTSVLHPVQPCLFFRLPGELRNKVYEMVFEPCELEIQWLQRRKSLTYWVYHSGDSAPNDTETLALKTNGPLWHPIFQHVVIDSDHVEDWRVRKDTMVMCKYENSPAALLLTSRAIHDEAVTMFYSRTSFGFASRGLLEKFLQTINERAKLSLSHLFLYHATYGEPYSTKDIRWKTVHDEKWESFCEKLSLELVGLRDLRILLRINDQPLKLNLTANWARPVLAFEKSKLQKFKLELLVRNHDSSSSSPLRSCARMVARTVLGTAHDVEDEKRSYRERCHKRTPKAIKCLVIRW
ncbi:hypothetical protein MMC13_000469 [Lambiella insularis]|nr:hypothetical protein [Lambiella insularis]